ncbi:hypothetical protein SASPL_145585 [Salvia splendens]|uniref:Myb/SANT-like domain-containing protein n=1 Tax=Salvia splendens TaxID=180675 RepID=A0A8X8Z8I4_SALSN|nr:hypothetical protein SASPL_145585 [Salvia splendens]
MGSNIPRQETFFYKAKWSAEVDSVLLSVIVWAKNMGRWSGSVIPIAILQEVIESIQSETGVSFSWLELYERYQFLEQCFHAFKLVWQTRGVYWNMQSNMVISPNSAWLAMLFGMEDVKKEENTKVVVIYDTTVLIYRPRPRRGIGPSSPCGEASDSVSSLLAENFATT